jgi:hypothetical protein
MKTPKEVFENFFTKATNLEGKNTKSMYREWNKQRDRASSFGSNHVAEIDAIFSRNI